MSDGKTEATSSLNDEGTAKASSSSSSTSTSSSSRLPEAKEEETRRCSKGKEERKRAVYGFLIKVDMTWTLVYHKDFGKAMGGCSIESLVSGKCRRFNAYADDQCLVNDVGFNDLAAHVLTVMGFDLSTFLAGVRGPILLANKKDDKAIAADDVDLLVHLCQDVKKMNSDEAEDDAGDSGDSDPLDTLIVKYKVLRG